MKKTTKSAVGTSYHAHNVNSSVIQLTKILGEPKYNDNTGNDKTNFEWVLETELGDVFTVYDYKEYRPIGEDETIEWHIGGKSPRITELAKDEIETVLKSLTTDSSSMQDAFKLKLSNYTISREIRQQIGNPQNNTVSIDANEHYGQILIFDSSAKNANTLAAIIVEAVNNYQSLKEWADRVIKEQKEDKAKLKDINRELFEVAKLAKMSLKELAPEAFEHSSLKPMLESAIEKAKSLNV